MFQVNQENIIVVLGDLGAGTNFVKNILMLSPEADFPILPIGKTRLEYLKQTAYPDTLVDTPDQWIKYEYRLRYWKHIYGTDVADNFNDINTPTVAKVSQTKKIVFICHWPEIANRLISMYPRIKIVSLHAEHPADVDWQVSMYIEKLGIEKLQNFSFNGNIQEQKQNYIQEHGDLDYQKFNALNMYEIMLDRKDTYANPLYTVVRINQLQQDDWILPLAESIGITLDLEQAKELAARWRSINPTKTKQWSNNDTTN